MLGNFLTDEVKATYHRNVGLQKDVENTMSRVQKQKRSLKENRRRKNNYTQNQRE